MEIRPAQRRAHAEPALDMSELGFGQGGGPGALGVASGAGARQFALDRPPVQTELAGQRANGPAMLVQDVEFHPNLSGLHGKPPVPMWATCSHSRTGHSRFGSRGAGAGPAAAPLHYS